MKSDSAIKSEVLTELKWDPSVMHEKINVFVESGVVTLLGSVPTFEEKKSAEAAVQRVVGVKAIVEGLEILSPETMVRDDVYLAKVIIDQFRWSAHLPGPAIMVKVEKGWVTLSGEVDKKSQSRIAENIVLSFDGVIGISNNIIFKSKDITVRVAGHKAILEGEVHSFKDMIAAREAALKTPGIVLVENNLIVD